MHTAKPDIDTWLLSAFSTIDEIEGMYIDDERLILDAWSSPHARRCRNSSTKVICSKHRACASRRRRHGAGPDASKGDTNPLERHPRIGVGAPSAASRDEWLCALDSGSLVATFIEEQS